MIRVISIGDKIMCLRCGKTIDVTNQTFTSDAYAEYICCPTCGLKADVQVYHFYGEKVRGGEMKICELKIKDMASANSITQALLLNGYSVESHIKFKEFPRETSIDCFVIEIYDHSTEKGGAE